jgi:hypothetical protein
MPELESVLKKVEALLERAESLLPAPARQVDWTAADAFRWRRDDRGGHLEAIFHPHRIGPEDLRGLARQTADLDRNTRQFIGGFPANNALLWGARGTGKSSLIKAMLTAYSDQGLRLIEVDKHDLIDLPQIVERLDGRAEYFVLYCDDLSFEADDASYKALKAVLDGSISVAPSNVLIYATSNRRHLLPEFMSENREARIVDGELHHGEAVEEKISLSERFGMWLSFHPFNQDTYLEIVAHWLGRLSMPANMDEEVRRQALEWALTRGSRSGRVAWQFARDQAGRHALTAGDPRRL